MRPRACVPHRRVIAARDDLTQG